MLLFLFCCWEGWSWWFGGFNGRFNGRYLASQTWTVIYHNGVGMVRAGRGETCKGVGVHMENEPLVEVGNNVFDQVHLEPWGIIPSDIFS